LKQQVYEHGLTDEIRDTFINVLDEASLASLSKTDKAAYDRKLKTYRDNHACLDYAIEHGIRQGLEMGEEKGIAKGRAEGREEGIAEGRLEGANAKQLEIAKAFKAKGIDLKTISECTDLSEDEIKKL
ncbi:MAG: hypothetical protein IKD16_01660, partial [Bacteroidales bacterium]|nr:hypothetical protein [Bacteroidales bacterium]